MSINLITGCMFSGKTSALINVAKINKLLGKKVLMINFNEDTRYTDANKVTSHDNISIDAFACSAEIKSIIDEEIYKSSDVICVNEAQFFKGLVEFCITACNSSKIVHVCGLDGDYLKRPFGEVLELIPHCETVKKLHALCLNCKDGTLASFTRRISDSSDLVVIGSKEFYQPVCRKCYQSNISPINTPVKNPFASLNPGA